jgi:hypothetical protein
MANLELRCAAQTLERGIDPIGTATPYDAYVLVEVPLPWPAAIGDHPLLGTVATAISASGWKAQVLGLVPERDAPDQHRVIAYRRPPGLFRRYLRSELVVAGAELGEATTELLGADLAADEPGIAQAIAPIGSDDAIRTDLLICTHGRRDRCCGSYGMNLFTAVGARHVRSGVRSWRVSHTGGHRFAPTAILLPEGHLWAWLDPELVDAVLHRRGDLDDVLEHYRGSSAIGSPPVQVAEREAFRREGWSWLDSLRSGSIVEHEGDRADVRIDLVRPDGSAGAFSATVDRVGTAPQPVCGELLTGEGNGKSDSIWSLTRFDPVDP